MSADPFGGESPIQSSQSTPLSLKVPAATPLDLLQQLLQQEYSTIETKSTQLAISSITSTLQSLQTQYGEDVGLRYGQPEGSADSLSFFLQPNLALLSEQSPAIQQQYVLTIGYLPYAELARALANDIQKLLQEEGGVPALLNLFSTNELAKEVLSKSLQDGLIPAEHAALVLKIIAPNSDINNLDEGSVPALFNTWSENLRLVGSGQVPDPLQQLRETLYDNIISGRPLSSNLNNDFAALLVATMPPQAPTSPPSTLTTRPSADTVTYNQEPQTPRKRTGHLTEEEILNALGEAIRSAKEAEELQQKPNPYTENIYFIGPEEKAALSALIKELLPGVLPATIANLLGPIDYTLGAHELSNLAARIYDLRLEMLEPEATD